MCQYRSLSTSLFNRLGDTYIENLISRAGKIFRRYMSLHFSPGFAAGRRRTARTRRINLTRQTLELFRIQLGEGGESQMDPREQAIVSGAIKTVKNFTTNSRFWKSFFRKFPRFNFSRRVQFFQRRSSMYVSFPGVTVCIFSFTLVSSLPKY